MESSNQGRSVLKGQTTMRYEGELSNVISFGEESPSCSASWREYCIRVEKLMECVLIRTPIDSARKGGTVSSNNQWMNYLVEKGIDKQTHLS